MDKYNKILYSNKIIFNLEDILSSPEKFEKGSEGYKEMISNEIRKLSVTNEYLGTYSNDYINKIIKEINYTDLYLFKTILRTRLNEKIERVNSGSINNQFFKLIKEELNIINYYDDGGNTKFFAEDYHSKFLKEINYNELLFHVLNIVTSCLDVKNYDKYLIENYHESYYIDGSKFFYKLRDGLLKYTIVNLLDFLWYKVPLNEMLMKINKNTINFINNKEMECLNNLTKQIEEIVINSLRLKISVVKKENSVKTVRLIELPKKIVEMFIAASHLPEIIEPNKWDIETLNQYIKLYKPVKNGCSDVKLSNYAINSLKESQKKKFVINRNAIELFKKMNVNIEKKDFDKYMDMKPFTPLPVLEDIRRKRNDIKLKLKSPDLKGERKKLFDEFNRYDRDYKTRLKLRVIHNTIIYIAEIYDKYPIYFINSIDYRTRMYLWSWFFSRVTGNYKYLMKEYDEIKLNKKGVENMMKAYYHNFKEEYDEFISLTSKFYKDEKYVEILQKI